MFAGIELEDSGTLNDYRISKESTLDLILKIDVRLKMSTGKLLLLELKSTDTVRDVKDKIHVKEGILPDRQRLMFDGKKLEDSCSVGECNIQSNSILNIETLEEDHGSRKNCILFWLHTFIYLDLQKRIQTVSMVQKWNKKKPFLVEFSRVVDARGFWYPNLAKLFLELVSSKKKKHREKSANNEH